MYRDVVHHLATVPVIAAPNLKKLAKEHGVQEETVYSIYSQEINSRVMKMHSALRSAAVGLLKRYAQGMFLAVLCIIVVVHVIIRKCRAYHTLVDAIAGDDIVDIVIEWRMPPCVMMRRLLECCTALGVKGSKHVTTLLKDPSLLQEVDTESVRNLFEDLEISISNQSPSEQQNLEVQFVYRLVQDIQWCTECDMVCGPSSDVARLKAGEQYEKKMYECLERAGISFWTEAELRGQGFHKTPDARLRVPIAVGERVVCWMDSKATFGDLKLHQCVEGINIIIIECTVYSY